VRENGIGNFGCCEADDMYASGSSTRKNGIGNFGCCEADDMYASGSSKLV
jgi:hypothetical protein